MAASIAPVAFVVLSIVAACVATLLVAAAGSRASPLAIIMLVGFAVVTVFLAEIDVRTHTLPNAIVVPSLLIAAVLLALDAMIFTGGTAVTRAGIGAATMFVVFFLLAVLLPGSIGGGDVKLIALTAGVTAWIGWASFVVALAAAFLMAGAVSLVLMAMGVLGRRSAVAFGPFLCAGAWIGIVLGHRVLPMLAG